MLRKELIMLSGSINFLRYKIKEKAILQEKRAKERTIFEEEMKQKGLVSFVNRNGEEKWGTPSQVKMWNRVDIGLENNFADYSPRDFERFIGELFEKMGYNVTLGPYGSDYGIDLLCKKDGRCILVEVKKYSSGNQVGNKEVRSTLGALWKGKADKAIFITTSDFTEQAYEQAKGSPIELWNFGQLEKFIEKYYFK